MRRLAIALVHHPVLDAQGSIVTSAITNLDVHDLARSARTYGVSDYFVVHPITAQRELVERIRSHWQTGSSGKRIPDRKLALELVRVVPSLDDAYTALGGRASIEVWSTAARKIGALDHGSARERALSEEGKGDDGKPLLILFGTAWGLAPSVIEASDAVLAPIQMNADYNHLSVRAACAILLDRLRGR
jgi:hypothetical protein